MGDIVRRGTKDKPRFYVRFLDVDGQRKQRAVKGAVTQAEARKVLAAIELRVTNGRVGIEEQTESEQEQRTITLDKLVEKFNAEYRPPRLKNPAEYRKQTESVYSCRVHETLGWRAASSITRVDIEKLRDELLDATYAPKSVSWTLARISKVYVWGKHMGYIDVGSPVVGVDHPHSEHSVDFLSKLEVGKLLAHVETANPEVYPMVATALYAGLRKGELYGLRWTDVVFDANRIDVRRSYDLAPKSGKPRHLPMHPELARILREWQPRCPVTDEGLVFPVLDGAGFYRMGIRTNMRGIGVLMKAAGCHVPAKAWHSLRHTFASHFIMSGGNILTLQKLLGHADLTMTLIYSHLAPDFMASEVARMSFTMPPADNVADIAEARRRKAAELGQDVDTGAAAEKLRAVPAEDSQPHEATSRTSTTSCASPRG